jgi:sulfhydrogenase subunit beta (sulfur reductase)
MSKTIRKEYVPYLVEELKKDYEVYAPIEKGNEFTIESVSDLPADKIRLEYNTTILPLKKLFFPREETLFTFSDNQIQVPELREDKALFGLHLSDAHSLLLLDEALNYRFEDYYYSSRRENTFVVCVDRTSETPDFSDILGLDVHAGYDLYLHDVGDKYEAIPESSAANDLLELSLFEENGSQEGLAQTAATGIFADIERLSLAVERGRKSEAFKDLTEICFGCGVCSYVCPVCYCFEVKDETELDLESGSRRRHWDACFLPDFALVAGYNFRESLQARIYHWYWHKFVQMPSIFGKVGCIGCGRCVYYCPARIDYREVVKTVIEELEQ